MSDQNNAKEEEKSAKYLKCGHRDKSEKLDTLKKHNNSKPTEKNSKVCSKEFKT